MRIFGLTKIFRKFVLFFTLRVSEGNTRFLGSHVVGQASINSGLGGEKKILGMNQNKFLAARSRQHLAAKQPIFIDWPKGQFTVSIKLIQHSTLMFMSFFQWK
jgi:hypothetical protein